MLQESSQLSQEINGFQAEIERNGETKGRKGLKSLLLNPKY